MAFLMTLIEGNEDFGGWLSVDGQKAVRIQDDRTLKLSNGRHSFTVYSKSNFDRANGNLQKSTGGVLSKAYGDHLSGEAWSFEANLGEADCACIHITSKGEKFVKDPTYDVIELTQEQVQELNAAFQKLSETPRRNMKQVWWGIGLIAVGIFGGINSFESMGWTSVGYGALFVAIGVILFLLGWRKKAR